MWFRLQAALISTLIFAGSWCLSNTKDNVFWLKITIESYFLHICVWAGVALFVFFALWLAFRRSEKAQNRLVIFFLLVSVMNLLDYGMRSVFGAVGAWPRPALLSWAAFTVTYPLLAAVFCLYADLSRAFLKKVMNAVLPVCAVLVFYGFPSGFMTLAVKNPVSPGNKPPVHLLLFDMLSHDVLFQDGEVRAHFPNFRNFSTQANVFHNCYSPAIMTTDVIPRVLAGIDFAMICASPDTWLVKISDDSQIKPITDCETIFSQAKKVGYNVFVSAFSIPYVHFFKDYIQFGKTYPFDRLWRVGMHSLVWPVLSPGGLWHQKTTEMIQNDYLDRIAKNHKNTFFYTHWNIPHDPYIFNANGENLKRVELIKNLFSSPNRKQAFLSQMKGTDRVFGSIMQAIQKSGDYDKSLIIVVADTNAKGMGLDMRHVPLLIKRPHQKHGEIIQDKATTMGLKGYLQQFFSTGVCDAGLLENKS